MTKKEQKFNKKVLFCGYFIRSYPFLGPVKRTNIAAHIEFIGVVFVQPHRTGVGFAIVWIEDSAIFPLRPTPLHLLDNEHAHDGLIVKFATALGAFGIWAVFSSFINVNDFTVEHTVFFVKFDN